MRAALFALAVAAALTPPLAGCRPVPDAARGVRAAKDRPSPVVLLYENRARDAWVECRGTVVRVLPDDTRPPRHERFVVRVLGAAGLTVLVAHNVDLAPRVPLAAGDTVAVRGLYEWNPQGGVLHETHHAAGRRAAGAGWVRRRGVTYQ